jgi:hypothetical protein
MCEGHEKERTWMIWATRSPGVAGEQRTRDDWDESAEVRATLQWALRDC